MGTLRALAVVVCAVLAGLAAIVVGGIILQLLKMM